MSKRIFAADDDASIRDILATFLVDAGYDVTVFETGDALYEAFQTQSCDLIILDIMMPGRSGLELTKLLREQSTVPIILLTAKDTDMDYVLGINSGSDDYMMKPFRPSILMSRIKALFRRIDMMTPTISSEQLLFGDLMYSEHSHAIIKDNQVLPFTQIELQLLRFMMEGAGRAISREQLLDVVWGIDAVIETRTTDETVRRVRKKLNKAQSNVVISTVWGYGYKLEVLT